MKLINYSLLILASAGCMRTYEVKQVNASQCVEECVTINLFNKKALGGGTISEMRQVCEASLKGRECCTSRYVSASYIPCDEENR